MAVALEALACLVAVARVLPASAEALQEPEAAAGASAAIRVEVWVDRDQVVPVGRPVRVDGRRQVLEALARRGVLPWVVRRNLQGPVPTRIEAFCAL